MATMSWALKRQIFYICILILFFAALGFLIVSPKLNKAPTCFDSKKNGTELGVDCGGSCALACTEKVEDVSILWSRAFQVVPGRYNAIAYLENHNKSAIVKKIGYRFRFADKDNVYIGKREGVTYIPAGMRFGIFEPAIDIGNSVPVYTTFEFTETPVWITVSETKINQLKLLVSEINLSNPDTTPALSATIKNNSLFSIPEINVVAILYDSLGNAISASRSYIDELKGSESASVNFTWPEKFDKPIVAKEIIPIFDILQVKLK